MILDPVKCTVQFQCYREMTQKSVARAIAYLAYLSLLFSIAGTLYIHIHAVPPIRDTTQWLAASVPALTLSEGRLSSALTAPLLLNIPKAEGSAILIDTNRTAPATLQEMQQQNLLILAAQNALYIRSKPDEMKLMEFSKIRSPKPIVVDETFIRAAGSMVVKVLIPVVFLGIWFFYFFWKLAASLVYSLLGLAINAATSSNLPYESLFKIAAYAQTPVVILRIAMIFVPTNLPKGFGVLAWLIVGIYTWQAIRQHHNPEPAENEAG